MGFFRALRWIRFIIFLLVIGAGSIFAICDGIQKRQAAREALTKYQKPITISADEFVKKQPTSGWYRITGCATNALDSAFVVTQLQSSSEATPSDDTNKQDVGEVLVAAYGANEDSEGPASIALLTRNQALCDVVTEMNHSGFFQTQKLDPASSPTPDDGSEDSSDDSHKSNASTKPANDKPLSHDQKVKLLAYLKKNTDRIFTTRTIEGMIDTEDDLDSNQKSALGLVREDLRPRFVIFEEGETPSGRDSSGATEIGLGVFGTVVVGLILLVIIRVATRRPPAGAVANPYAPATSGLYNRWGAGAGPVLGGDFKQRGPTVGGASAADVPDASSATPKNSWSAGRATDIADTPPPPPPAPE